MLISLGVSGTHPAASSLRRQPPSDAGEAYAHSHALIPPYYLPLLRTLIWEKYNTRAVFETGKGGSREPRGDGFRLGHIYSLSLYLSPCIILHSDRRRPRGKGKRSGRKRRVVMRINIRGCVVSFINILYVHVSSRLASPVV